MLVENDVVIARVPGRPDKRAVVEHEIGPSGGPSELGSNLVATSKGAFFKKDLTKIGKMVFVPNVRNTNSENVAIVFTSMPGGGSLLKFVEVEDGDGASINIGRWEVCDDGFVRLWLDAEQVKCQL